MVLSVLFHLAFFRNTSLGFPRDSVYRGNIVEEDENEKRV